TPDWTDSVIRTTVVVPGDPDKDSSMFEVLPLEPSDRDAWFMHLWWSGDNGFSFAPKPKHNHLFAKGTEAKMTDITTENYGTGGPPPLTYTFLTEHQGNNLTKVLGVDTFLHVQTYRNAVINDTMYLIVTYGNPQNVMVDGNLRFDVGNHAEICNDEFTKHPHYFPNGEYWDPSTMVLKFDSLKYDEERSVLIPVYIRNNREAFLEMSVESTYNGGEGTTLSATPAVAQSHDPNLMIAETDTITDCDYRGGNIHYTVKFQNDGGARTDYVRVECYLDEKVDLNSILTVDVPVRFYPQGSWKCRDTTIIIRYGHETGRGAVWKIDYDRRVLIVEMHDIRLYHSSDPNLPRIDMARGQIEFDVKVKDNYIFGKPVVAHSEIFFDNNPPIPTNVVKTGCEAPIPLIKGGGFQSGTQSIICQWIWWIIGLLLLIILILFIMLRRSKRKRKNLIRILERTE
ncbi:MAG: hypothetical protein AB8B56_09585, partial [Crocinitomicaceae bacterium]